MDWYDFSGKYHEQTFPHESRLSSLPEDWQRELAALWRLEADVNNGGYLQFLVNWGHESYVYASQALKKIGAHRMAEIVDCCQALVDEHLPPEQASRDRLEMLIPNALIGPAGKIVKEAGSTLSDETLAEINELSYEFMDYPENLPQLGLNYYQQPPG